MMYKGSESAAKPLRLNEYGERSQTISKESTLHDDSGSGEPLPDNTEGEDIVESRSKKFFERSVEKHGMKYTYDKVVYKNAKTKVLIGCLAHGYFEQTPDKHLNTLYCCPKCFELHRRLYLKNIKRKARGVKSFSVYLKKVFDKYGKIDISVVGEWDGIIKSNVEVKCKKHGITTSNARNLIQGPRTYSCQMCSDENRQINKTDTQEDIVGELTRLFDKSYEYIFPDSYKTKKNLITVICPNHGTFKRSVTKLLSGQYCSKCRIEHLIDMEILVGGYSDALFINNPKLKDLDGVLYYLKINGGSLYKIGITKKRDSKNRMRALRSKSRGSIKEVEEVYTKRMTLYEAYLLEQKILKEYSYLREKRPWSTELFKKDISEHILHYFT